MGINLDRFSDKQVAALIRGVLGGREVDPGEVKIWRRLLKMAKDKDEFVRYFEVDIPRAIKASGLLEAGEKGLPPGLRGETGPMGKDIKSKALDSNPIDIDSVSDEAVAAKFKEVFGVEDMNQGQLKLARYILKRAQRRQERVNKLAKYIEGLNHLAKASKMNEN